MRAVPAPRRVSRCATGRRHPTGSTAPCPRSAIADRAAADRRPRAGAQRRQPHRAARSPATTRASCSTARCSKFGFAQRTLRGPPRRRARARRLHDHQRGALRAAARTSRRPPRSRPAAASSGRASPSCRNLRAIVALGRIAHDSTLAALRVPQGRSFPFAHGPAHAVRPGLALFDSFHCSRYNTNTRRLTPEMFHAVFAAVRELLPPRRRRPRPARRSARAGDDLTALRDCHALEPRRCGRGS